mmetsp:Transcript_30991/g.41713  ORF Transcript_30991/g.41713 Transcript_30991/m.41713 type:complete len:215 (-) Transcript_30991:161-805(-)
MVVVRSGFLVAAVSAAAWTVSGPLFLQISPGARPGTLVNIQTQQQPSRPMARFEQAEPVQAEDRSVQGLVFGLALGLVVGLAGLGLPGTAKAEEVAAPADYDIRTGQSQQEQEAWNKAKFKIWADRQFSSPPDKKFSIPTTGAGRYKQFGMDKFSPIPTIPDMDNGTYPIKNYPPAPNEALLAKIPEWKKSGFLRESKYGNYYSANSPFPYNPK